MQGLHPPRPPTCRRVLEAGVAFWGEVQQLVGDLPVGTFVWVHGRDGNERGAPRGSLQDALGEVRDPKRAEAGRVVVDVQDVDRQLGCGGQRGRGEGEEREK